jgi:hypothetical protein
VIAHMRQRAPEWRLGIVGRDFWFGASRSAVPHGSPSSSLRTRRC